MAELLQKSWWVPVIRGIVTLLFGIFALVNPEAAGRLLILIFGIYLLIDGIFNIISAVGLTNWPIWNNSSKPKLLSLSPG